MALFAPAWTYESLETSDKIFEDFLNRDSAFWTSLWPYLYTHTTNDFFTTNFYIGLDQVGAFSWKIVIANFLTVLFLIKHNVSQKYRLNVQDKFSWFFLCYLSLTLDLTLTFDRDLKITGQVNKVCGHPAYKTT